MVKEHGTNLKGWRDIKTVARGDRIIKDGFFFLTFFSFFFFFFCLFVF